MIMFVPMIVRVSTVIVVACRVVLVFLSVCSVTMPVRATLVVFLIVSSHGGAADAGMFAVDFGLIFRHSGPLPWFTPSKHLGVASRSRGNGAIDENRRIGSTGCSPRPSRVYGKSNRLPGRRPNTAWCRNSNARQARRQHFVRNSARQMTHGVRAAARCSGRPSARRVGVQALVDAQSGTSRHGSWNCFGLRRRYRFERALRARTSCQGVQLALAPFRKQKRH